jgi:long-chain acyl-CoA synthetase
MVITSLADIVRYHAKERPDDLAMLYVQDERSWTFRELDLESNRVANALVAEGVGEQDRIAYLDKNSPEYFTSLYGGAKLNAVSVALNWRLSTSEMEYVINHSEAKVLIVGREFLAELAQLKLPTIRKVVVIGDPAHSGHQSYEQWIRDRSPTDPSLPANPEDTCFQLYTSGTTGLPKGVLLTHNNCLGLMREGLNEVGFNERSVSLVCMPVFHIAGSGWGVAGQFRGAQTILLREVDPEEILRAIPGHAVTHALFVPAVLQFLLDMPGVADADYSSLERVVYAASPISEHVLATAMQTFACKFTQMYGMTETTGGVTVLSPEDHENTRQKPHLLLSCGKPIAGSEIKIVDTESLEELPDREVGEIWVRGPQTMKAYWKNEQATREVLVEDGWLRTGDAGYFREGYLYIHDRVKDMIISGGENIYPAEVENVLMRHPDVSDAAVIGVPDERWGETVKAVVTRSEPTLTQQTLLEFCRSNLAHYKCPTSIDWMDAIPRNASGKILKSVLREPYWKDRGRSVG